MPVGTPVSPVNAPAPPAAPKNETPTKEADAKTSEKSEDKPKVKAQPRDYNIYTRHTGTIDEVVQAIRDAAKDGNIDVLLFHGTGNALQPKLALQKYGQSTEGDLEGEYEVAASGSFKNLKVSTEPVEVKRKVKFL